MTHWTGNPDDAFVFAQQFALDYFLQNYAKTLTYDQILTAMTEKKDWASEIDVFLPFDKMSGKHLADMIHLMTMSLTARLINA